MCIGQFLHYLIGDAPIHNQNPIWLQLYGYVLYLQSVQVDAKASMNK